MAEIIGISEVSSKDEGRGSHLKTGNMSRSYNKVSKCKAGQVYSKRLRKCIQCRNYMILIFSI